MWSLSLYASAAGIEIGGMNADSLLGWLKFHTIRKSSELIRLDLRHSKRKLEVYSGVLVDWLPSSRLGHWQIFI